MELLEYIKYNRLYLDGAMGTALMAKGLDTNKGALLNVLCPTSIASIHKDYINIGCKLIYTNTFGANRRKIKDKLDLKATIKAGVCIARKCADSACAYVAYDCGSIGELLEPCTSLTMNEAYDIFAEQAKIIKDLPIDCVVIETMMDIVELKIAIRAFRDHVKVPIFCSMSFGTGGRTLTGCAIPSFCLTVEGLGVSAIGLNCSLGAIGMVPLVKELINYANVPIFVKPNAGLPIFCDGESCYDTDKDNFSDQMIQIAKLGVSMLGGCCGTDKEYLAKTIEKTKAIPYKFYKNNIKALCTPSKILLLNEPRSIGRALDSTTTEAARDAIVNFDMDTFLELALDDVDMGAEILAINVDTASDPIIVMENVIKTVMSGTNTPLCIISGDIEVLKAGLKIVNGICLVQYAKAGNEACEQICKLANRYGAYVLPYIEKTTDKKVMIDKDNCMIFVNQRKKI